MDDDTGKVRDTRRSRRRIHISPAVKSEMLMNYQTGKRVADISRELGVRRNSCQAIVTRWKQGKLGLNGKPLLSARDRWIYKRNVMRTLNDTLNVWIKMQKKEKAPLSTAIVRQKALDLYAELIGELEDDPRPFSASKGWWWKFKCKYNVDFHSIDDVIDDVAPCSGSKTLRTKKNKTNAASTAEKRKNKMQKMSNMTSPYEFVGIGKRLELPKSKPNGKSVRMLTKERMSKAFQLIKEGLDILAQEDPNPQRSATISRLIEQNISCYKKLYMEKIRSFEHPLLT